MITEKELISKLQSLKQIKPNQNWAILVKKEILDLSAQAGNNTPNKAPKPSYSDVVSSVLSLIFQRKMAYALAALLIVFAGTFGFFKLVPQGVRVSEKSPAALVAENAIKDNVEMFKIKSQTLAEAAKNKTQDVSLAIQEVEEAAKELTDAIEKNPELAKTVALDINNNKTYLYVGASDDLKETSDNLCKAVVGPMIEDTGKLIEAVEEASLANGYQNSLNSIKSLQDDSNCYSVLENVLLLYIAINQDS